MSPQTLEALRRSLEAVMHRMQVMAWLSFTEIGLLIGLSGSLIALCIVNSRYRRVVSELAQLQSASIVGHEERLTQLERMAGINR